MEKEPKEINLFLAEPRGFCAGVRRAISIVEEALQKYGSPIYVRHEIVHNRHVIEDLKAKGAIFVEEISDIPQGATAIFSAHGVSQSVIKEAQEKGLNTIDATCPLVEKVHRQIKKYAAQDMEIIIIGKAAHPEIIGTLGQIPNYKKIHVIRTQEDAEKLSISSDQNIGFVSQTTLSVDDTAEIIKTLKEKYPNIKGLEQKDICYATTNRQKAIKELTKVCDCILVLGSPNSSNSKQLKEVALKNGAKQAYLIDDASELNWDEINPFQNIGISAGASAPEYLVEELIENFKRRYDKIKIHNLIITKENINFKI